MRYEPAPPSTLKICIWLGIGAAVFAPREKARGFGSRGSNDSVTVPEMPGRALDRHPDAKCPGSR